MLQSITHYFLHFLAIGGIAYLYDRENWLKYWLVLLGTMLVDLDHLVASPVFQPDRCSIGFHILHTYYAALIYLLAAVFVRHKILRLVFIGLLFHMFTDFVDCLWMASSCEACEFRAIMERFT